MAEAPAAAGASTLEHYAKCSVEGCAADTNQRMDKYGAILEHADGEVLCIEHAVEAIRNGRIKDWDFKDYILVRMEKNGEEPEEEYDTLVINPKCIECEIRLCEDDMGVWLQMSQKEPKCEDCLDKEDEHLVAGADADEGGGGGGGGVKGLREPGVGGRAGKPTKVYRITNGFAHKSEAAPVTVEFYEEHPSQMDAFRRVYELCGNDNFDASFDNHLKMYRMYHRGGYIFPWLHKKDCISVEGKLQPKAGAFGLLNNRTHNGVDMPHEQYLVVINDHESNPKKQFPWGTKYFK